MFDKEPEDIFSDVEPARSEPLRPSGAVSPTVPGRPGVISPVGARPEVSAEELGGEEGGGGKKKIFLVVIALVLLLILGAGGYLAWQQIGGKGTAVKETTNTPAEVNVNLAPIVPAVTPTPTPEVPTEPVTLPSEEMTNTPPPLDSDGDGLSDAEEATLGTDPAMSDTDSDGLTDREEVQIYQTNPLNPDTDGDSYLDGNEVRDGYNPNGPGKLFELPQ